MSQPKAKISGGRVAPEPATQPEVPPTEAERDRLLRVVHNYVSVRKPVPPLTGAELRRHTDSILATAGIDEAYRKFVTVLVNNEAWRTTVAGIPFNRRLLLLPKCFRAEAGCPGTFDQLGLICRRCGRCPLDELQAEAERLGYAVLVAEGSAAVTAVIEQARLEAIVGVSCLSVLERVFPHMEASAIPGIAIPLLRDGCRDTAADMDWVWDAVYLTGGGGVRRLNLDDLRRRVEGWFTTESLPAVMGEPTTQTERIAQEWLAGSGKRWRPFLAACAFEAMQDQPDGAAAGELPRIAVAVECFHKASLIHDDIEDQDEFRDGRKTLHCQHGVPIALNVGDYLLGEGYRLIAASAGGGERKAAMLQAAATGHRLLTLGQGEELCWMRNPRPLSPAEVLTIFRGKTAPAFSVALRLGTLLAGGGDELQDVLMHYSANLGIAYQIRDDLEDFAPAGGDGDARAMRPSLLLAIAWELADGGDRKLLESGWTRSGARHAVADPQVARILADLNVRQTAEQLLESYKAEAVAVLSALDNGHLKGLLRRVIGKIFHEAELRGWCREPAPEHAPGRQPGTDTAA